MEYSFRTYLFRYETGINFVITLKHRLIAGTVMIGRKPEFVQ
ncbi:MULTISPECIES: hypothetical protein [unclassified Sporolactobacillus]|nr:hypothetical protein [Sporolactobacillus sp. CQH2019]MDD9149403.1 hypothetical protein [Sporolactobacillus sp. CQH2019]